MPWCVLRYCTSNSKNKEKYEGITFHRFPSEIHKSREEWIKFVQINRSEETWLPSNYSCICSLHFREEDKYITKGRRRFLKKSAVPCDSCDNQDTGAHDIIEPISESVSESESIFDTPKKIVFKKKIRILTAAKKRLTVKFKKVQRQNRNLKKKCESLQALVKSLKTKLMMLQTDT